MILGCVHMKYISPEEGFSVKVSYDKNVLHSSKIKGKVTKQLKFVACMYFF